MKNNTLDFIRSKIKLNIKGKRIDRFILKIHHNNINILHIENISLKEANIIVYYHDYDKIIKLNTIYEIEIVEYAGMKKQKNKLVQNKYFILFIILSITIICVLSKLTFKIDVITTDRKMHNILLSELKERGIEKYRFKKSYNDLQKIKESIIEEYKDKIEWLEIEIVGTKYIVRFEPRIIKEENETRVNRHIVALKNAVIVKVTSSKGQILKYQKDYVSKGDIVISGHISLNGEIKDTVEAKGEVYGEVWYTATVTYPFGYYEESKTGNTKNIYSVKFLNKTFYLFDFKPFNDKIENSKVIIKNNLLPISINKNYQEEIEITESINTVEVAYMKALDRAIYYMNKKLKEEEYIMSYKVLSNKVVDDGVEIKVFFSVCENITGYQEIEEIVGE